MGTLGYDFAYIYDKRVAPYKFSALYHGTDLHAPDQVITESGLPKKGTDLDLVRHAEPVDVNCHSAFRGATLMRWSPFFDAGAAQWGKWVYEVSNYPGYDLANLLQGRIKTPTGYRDPHMAGEQEIAIPAEVPLSNIVAAFEIVDGARGNRPVYVENWRGGHP